MSDPVGKVATVCVFHYQAKNRAQKKEIRWDREKKKPDRVREYLPKAGGRLVNEGCFVADNVWVLDASQVSNLRQSIVFFALTCRFLKFDHF